MGFVQNVVKRIPSVPSPPPLDDPSRGKHKSSSRLAFFKRRIRLKGNSKISVPLGAVLLFPCIVIILILVLVIRHDSSTGGMLMPAGAPPTIRWAIIHAYPLRCISEHSLTHVVEKSVRNTTKCSCLAAWSRRSMDPGRTLCWSSWHGIKSWRELYNLSNHSKGTSTDGSTIPMFSSMTEISTPISEIR